MAALEPLLYQLGAASNVAGWFIGFKRKRGRKLRRLAIVCCVKRKLPPSQLAKATRLPRTLRWREGKHLTHRIPIDVQELGPSGRYAAFAGPADSVFFQAGPRATAGVAVALPALGQVLTTAAHAVLAAPGQVTFGANAPSLTLSNSGTPGVTQGVAVQAVWTEDTDLAFLRLSSSQPTNLFADRFRVGPPFFPLSSDIGRQVFALTARGALPMRYEGPMPVMQVGNATVRSGLLTTPLSTGGATQGGDSGCGLVDDQFRLWGLLLGFVTISGRVFSVFQSPASLLAAGARML